MIRGVSDIVFHLRVCSNILGYLGFHVVGGMYVCVSKCGRGLEAIMAAGRP